MTKADALAEARRRCPYFTQVPHAMAVCRHEAGHRGKCWPLPGACLCHECKAAERASKRRKAAFADADRRAGKAVGK